MEACSLLVNLRKGMQSSSEQPLVGKEHCVTTLIMAAKETSASTVFSHLSKLAFCVRAEIEHVIATIFQPSGRSEISARAHVIRLLKRL